MNDDVTDAARTAERSTPFRLLARGGYAASGLVHVLIGVIVLVVAAGGDAESDQAGAFKAVAAAPLGFAALWVLAIALWALAAWHVAEGILARAPGAEPGSAEAAANIWGTRVSEWGQAAAFLVLGIIAAAVALGARPDGEEAVEGASGGILSIIGGPVLLGLVGVGVGVGGIVFVVMGFRRSFRSKTAIPDTALGHGVEMLGAVGFVAKGVALAIVGVLLVVAAIRIDPDAAGGLDGAIQALLALPSGPWLAGTVGAGLIAYGGFCFFRARYARL